MKRHRILVLSRNYPNAAMPLLGLWIERWTRQMAGFCECRVVAPVPYCPPVPAAWEMSRFRRIAASEVFNGIRVSHPRFASGPGYSLHRFESRLWLLTLRRHIELLRKEFPFDLIHAHFSYPDGVVAAELGKCFGVPVIITEHARWSPWMEQYPSVRRRAVEAARTAAFHTGVSRFVTGLIRQYTGESERLVVTPLGVDGAAFTLPDAVEVRDPNQILYVGRLHLVKGVDVLLRAMSLLVRRRPAARLVLLGGNFYRNTSGEVDQMHRLAEELGLRKNVTFVGPKPPAEVAEFMRRSAVVALASRSETFGNVLVEALACGTPVVATKCGGPEDIVVPTVGILVPKEDPAAMADALEAVLDHPEYYPPDVLRTYALERFSWEVLGARTLQLYDRAIARGLCLS